jgi:hypothetical protein
LFQNESSLVCNEENIHETQVVLEPWQKQSTFSFNTKSTSWNIKLVFNVIFKRYHFLPTFKMSYLKSEFVGLLKAKGGTVIHFFFWKWNYDSPIWHIYWFFTISIWFGWISWTRGWFGFFLHESIT